MAQQWPAEGIARLILEGFDDYREHFRQITDGARARFEQAQWAETQIAAAARINLYEEKVSEVTERLRRTVDAEILLDVQRERGLPAPGDAVVRFWDRPYRTVDDAVAAGLAAGITDPEVAALPPYVGSVEQWVDSVDVLAHADRRAALQVAYRTWIGGV